MFICQDEDQRDRFLDAADRELTGKLSHQSAAPDEKVCIGRRQVLFACDLDAHARRLEARRVPAVPPDARRRRGAVDVRAVRLPSHPNCLGRFA
jgi:hypothetical protein